MIYILHISDLHLVVNPDWNNMKNAILNSVKDKLQNVPKGEKLLIITGDFHNFKENSYDQTENFLPELFDAMGIEPDKDVFVVPGNHDVLQDDPADINRESIISSVKESPETLNEINKIDKLLLCYDSYINLVKKVKVYADSCGNLPVNVHVRSWRNKINILHLNTTIVADDKEKKRQMVDALSATSDKICKELCNGDLPRFAIGHNSFYDLLEAHKENLRGIFYNQNISAYLCGDRHQKNKKIEEKYITFTDGSTIPNVVSYKTSTDENDNYSDFGMIWHILDEEKGCVDLEYMKWDKADQAKLIPDGNGNYIIRKNHDNTKNNKNRRLENWLNNEEILNKSSIEIKPYYVKSFLHGARCKWNIAFSDGIIPRRKTVDDLYKRVVYEGGVYALTGPGGEGKSTALMQLCAMLIKNGFDVLYYRGFGKIIIPDNISENTVFIIDNPPEKQMFKHFLNSVTECGYTLVLGARKNEWNLLKKSLCINDCDVEDVLLPVLTESESWDFASCVCKNLQHSKSIEQIKEIFQNNSYGFLYAAMLLAVEDKNSLDGIAQQIIENLNNKSKSALLLLAHIVMSEWCGVDFEKKQYKPMCKTINLIPNKGDKALSKEVSLNGNKYQTRHEVIQKLFFKYLFFDSGVLSLDDIDKVLSNLFEFHFQHYQKDKNYYADPRRNGADCITKLSAGLEFASSRTQEFLIQRIVDEFKTQTPSCFNKFATYMKDEEIQLLFYKICFDRQLYSSYHLRSWCDLLIKNGSLWKSNEPYSPSQIFRKVCINHNADSNTWLTWAQLENKYNGVGDYNSENTARWIYREACINHNADSNTWRAWAQLEDKYSGAGDYNSENTARWICREACKNHNADSNTWLAWAQLEDKYSGAGDYKSKNTARWICREACINHNADSVTWLAWAQLEDKYSGAGDYKSKNTARWIYHEACKNHNADSNAWLAWAQLEDKYNGAGDYNSENTARWIYREACKNHNADSITWRAWAQLEDKYSGVGDYNSENTARWIYREACINHNADSNTWSAWAQLEDKYNGAGDYNSENTARWIYREACINHNADSNTWRAWAQLEDKYNGAGDYNSENTARWIYREACKNHNADSNTWLAWAQLEDKYSGAGGYNSENTARWIYYEACKNHNADSITWLAWAQLEDKYSGAGDYNSENTARWIYYEACKNYNADSITWLAWAQLEDKYSGAGDYNSENTARWIYREACKNHNADSNTWRAWAQLEDKYSGAGDYNSENTARWIYREACMNHKADVNTWLAWADLEVGNDNIGEYNKEYSARWIYKEICINRSFPGKGWQKWAQFEKSHSGNGNYNVENTTRWILRKACIEHNFHCFIWQDWVRIELQDNNIGDFETENTALWICSEGIKRFPKDDELLALYLEVQKTLKLN